MADLPPQSIDIDALNTATPNLADLPQRTSTYERPFTHEGNYLVIFCDPNLMTLTLKLDVGVVMP